jgi:hypothetical protein
MTLKKIYDEVNSCRICGSQDLHEVLDLGMQPPANSLRETLAESVPEAPLTLIYCKQCSTAQLTATVDPYYLFNQYVWVTATSSTARAYSEIYADEVLVRTKLTTPFVVEIASNDGTFLRKFMERGCKVLGIDPAENIASIASSSGIPTWAKFFDENIADKIFNDEGTPDIVMARNVIPHVKEIHSIAKGMSSLVKQDGIAVVEFHYAKKILQELHYDSIYHEHLFYFSLKTICDLFSRYGLHAYDLFESPISGGSLVLFLSKSKLPTTEIMDKFLAEEDRLNLNELSTWVEFGEKCKSHAKALKELVVKYSSSMRLLAYGASARSSTMLNFAKISSEEIESIVDKSPLKQGLYTPGTNIPIVSFESAINGWKKRSMLLLAWNFTNEIESDLRRHGFDGDIIIPLPNEIRVK